MPRLSMNAIGENSISIFLHRSCLLCGSSCLCGCPQAGSSVLNTLHESGQGRFAGEAGVARHNILPGLKDGTDIQGGIDQLHQTAAFSTFDLAVCNSWTLD